MACAFQRLAVVPFACAKVGATGTGKATHCWVNFFATNSRIPDVQ
jgi:hypothetical protein